MSLLHPQRPVPRAFLVLLVAACTVVVGCASARPVLYPNAQYQREGPAAAQSDIDDCIALAARSGVTNEQAAEVAKKTAGGAVVGGATGAVGGAIWGRPGRAAAAGAAAGGVAGLFRGLFGARMPDPILRGFVDRCLREKGYDPIGWR